MFIVLLTLAIALFLAPFFLATRWHWPLWIAAGSVILLTAPLRAWGLHRGLLSYYVHGTAVEGSVAAVEPAGAGTWRVRFRYGAPGIVGLPDGNPTRGMIEGEVLVYDALSAPLGPGDAVPVLFRPGDPRDAVLPTLAGILDADAPE